jgi:hypothetical protein
MICVCSSPVLRKIFAFNTGNVGSGAKRKKQFTDAQKRRSDVLPQTAAYFEARNPDTWINGRLKGIRLLGGFEVEKYLL